MQAATQTIVVVDDEARICQSFQRALAKWGYRVEAFSNENDALERIKAGGVDLVVSDLMMPQRTGIELLKEMRAAGVNTPLVMITGYATTENALETMRLGAVDYLPKPFTVEELRSVIARGLRAGAVRHEYLPRPPAGTYEIRNHSWVRRGGADELLVGVHPFVLECCGQLAAVELPMEEDDLMQGGACGKLLATDSRVPIRLWAPVSGCVTATNARVVERPAELTTDPYGTGWLIKLRPTQFEKDIQALSAAGRG